MKLRLPALLTLLSAVPAFAVTDTWDGNQPNAGAGDSNIATGLNWADNTAPLSDLVNTDLIFAGTTKLTPNVSVAFSTDSITFNNTAGAFIIGGQTLAVGLTGVVNNDADLMTFNNALTFGSVAASTINAALGALDFNGQITLPTGTLTIDGGAATSFTNIAGSGAITKQGAATMTWTPGTTVAADVTISTGTLTMAADATTNVFASTSTIAVNGTSVFTNSESLTLDGAQLTRASGAAFNLAAGKTFTIQNGAGATLGAHTFSTAATVAVTDPGSTLSMSGGTISGGTAVNVTAGGSLTGAGALHIAPSGGTGNGTLTVDGAGSTATNG